MVSAVLAEHNSVGQLLESRCAAATSKVLEALRERASRSIEEADVIERESLAGFAAPFDSFLSIAAHDKLGNSHSLLYSQIGRFGGKSTGVLPGVQASEDRPAGAALFTHRLFPRRGSRECQRCRASLSASIARVPLRVVAVLSYRGGNSRRKS